MQKYDIYQVNAQCGLAVYPRPCVIIAVYPAFYTVALISSNFDLYNPVLDFIIDADCPEFPKTGLNKKCYVIGSNFPKQAKEDFIYKRGFLSGSLLDDFNEWIGE